MARDECIRLHPGSMNFLWNDSSAMHFIQENFPHLGDLWGSHPYPIQRVDALRYTVLQIMEVNQCHRSTHTQFLCKRNLGYLASLPLLLIRLVSPLDS
ncbi:hypothetical protein BGW36DRAFT_435999 [Talaromyces proteolyticus]|uniref:Uncharacterized protein n=1 Tax=Talaromyces proteolyticus TaxID=1131652 RepID=A0AAD4L3I0_9EURO|nr:uncharacterized protein BGW36DRAFT_435999 [Talaromyces proteolyticus]KAH8705930.1 hypothetical protein BGW36DRAFT_435999 [Talaromyces proteolyticus]